MVAYLDCAASVPPKGECLAECASLGEKFFANPSSQHSLGRQAWQLLQDCRAECLRQLQLSDAQAIFCSSATEANNIVCTSFLNSQSTRGLAFWGGPHLHPSLEEPLKQLSRFGNQLKFLPLDNLGRVDVEQLDEMFRSAPGRYIPPSMVALNAVDGETGLLQPVESVLGQIARTMRSLGRRTWVHLDAVQWCPRLPLPHGDWHSLVISGHKMGAIRGTALLLLRRQLTPLYRGGRQEGGVRSGTENLAAVLNFTKVLRDLAPDRTRIVQMHSYLLLRLKELPACYRLYPKEREENEEMFVPGLLALQHRELPGEVLLRMLDQRGVIVGTGSACRNNKPHTSKAEYIRVSFAANSKREELDALIVALKDIARG